MASALDSLRDELCGLVPRLEGLAGPAAAEEVEQCRANCRQHVARVRQASDAANAQSQQASEAELKALTATRDKLRAAVAERAAFLNESQLELQALALDINRLLLNADDAAAAPR